SAAAELAGLLASTTVGSVIGRGFAFPPALEIALKLKETSYTRAEPFSAADFLHGPVTLVEPNYSALLVDVGGRSSQAAVEIADAVRQRGGQAALIRAGEIVGQSDLPNLSLTVPVSEPIAPIVALVLGQLFAVDLAVERWQRGGRVVLFGAGTSGRLATLDAAELGPTFGVPSDRYMARLAGGEGAFLKAREGAEDDRAAGANAADDLSSADVGFGIAASGQTPWVIGALERARQRGAATIGLACVPQP